MISPIVRQLMVVGSTLLAALSVGGVIAYPSVLLQQFRSNDTIVQLDLHNGSWIGSVHGIAGIPSVLMPLLMQYRGRKPAFILACLLIVIGWTISYAANNVITIIIAECFHGLGGNSLLVVSSLSVSEMVQPKIRNACLLLYATMQALGISSVGIIGCYLHWKTVGLIMCTPILLAVPVGCMWPESPSWLAYKGKFEECRKTFENLRGTDEKSKLELNALLSSKKESNSLPKKEWFRYLRDTVSSRDFFVPAIHNMILMNVTYWCGCMPTLIYSSDMILKASGKPNPPVKLFMDISLFVGYCVSSVVVRFYSSKNMLLISMSGSVVFFISSSVVTYLQWLGLMPKDSEVGVYCIAALYVTMSLGACSLGMCLASELMPVKHRGIGGCLFVICTCVFHSSCLKAYPYLCVYINIWGVFLLYATLNIFSIIFIWKYVPETKNRTLQELEEYYINGHFKKFDDDNAVIVPFIKLEKNSLQNKNLI